MLWYYLVYRKTYWTLSVPSEVGVVVLLRLRIALDALPPLGTVYYILVATVTLN